MYGYITFRIGAFLSRNLPASAAYWIGLRAADICYRIDNVGRTAVKSNLGRVYMGRGVVPSEQMIDGMARKTYQYYGKYLVDFFRCARLSAEDVRKRISIEHPEYLEQVKKLGRGVLLTTAHFGNWELGGAAITALGCDIHAVEMPQRHAKLNNLLHGQRAARGLKLLPAGSAISIMKCLKRGGMVAVLADRDFSPRNDRVPFFGLPARMPVGPAWLSHRTGAAILPSFLFRLEDDTFLLRFYPPILPEQEGSVQAIRRKMVSVLEREIGERPCQWFIFEDFWKTSGQTWHGEPVE